MELSPMIYHHLIRPKWFSNIYFSSIFRDHFDFNDKTVLDFGCGTGFSSPNFKSSSYIGVDCDSKRIEYAKKLYPGYKFTTLKNDKLPLEKDSVDYILILSVLHHIPTDSLNTYLKEFNRVLKPNGVIIASEPCLFRDTNIQNWWMCKVDNGKYIRNESEYLDLFHKASYKTQVLKRYNQMLLYNKLFFTATSH